MARFGASQKLLIFLYRRDTVQLAVHGHGLTHLGRVVCFSAGPLKSWKVLLPHLGDGNFTGKCVP